jgi:hypothetical protein
MLSWNGLFSRGFFFFFSEHPTTAIEVVRMVGGGTLGVSAGLHGSN